jgi:TatD DNase family protein
MADLHCTAGCHPTSTSEIETYEGGQAAYMSSLSEIIKQDRGEGGSKKIVSIGEIGLGTCLLLLALLTHCADYDRLHYAPKEVQLKHFPPLFDLSKTFRLPLFLHSRSPEAHVDFVKILRDAGWDETWPGGVVHSFTGTIAEAKELVCLLYIRKRTS